MRAAKAREIAIIKSSQLGLLIMERSRGRPVQPSDNVEQRRLSAARGAKQDEDFAGANIEIDPSQRMNLGFTSDVDLAQVSAGKGVPVQLHSAVFGVALHGVRIATGQTRALRKYRRSAPPIPIAAPTNANRVMPGTAWIKVTGAHLSGRCRPRRASGASGSLRSYAPLHCT